MQARIDRLRELSKIRNEKLATLEENCERLIHDEQSLQQEKFARQFIEKIPQRLQHKSMQDFHIDYPEQATVKKVVSYFIQTFDQRLAEGTTIKFLGRHGTGKTYLAHIICQMLVHQGYSVHYESTLEFLRSLYVLRCQNHSTYITQLNSFKNTQLLVLDEITETVSKDGNLTECDKQLLFSIIDTRYQQNVCTLIISNRDQNTIDRRLGASIADRLSYKAITLAFNWKSYRQKREEGSPYVDFK